MARVTQELALRTAKVAGRSRHFLQDEYIYSNASRTDWVGYPRVTPQNGKSSWEVLKILEIVTRKCREVARVTW